MQQVEPTRESPIEAGPSSPVRGGPGVRRWLLHGAWVVAGVAVGIAGWLYLQDRPLRRMRAAEAKQDWVTCLRLTLPYLSRHPEDAEVLRLVARSLMGLEQFAAAEQYFAKAGELSPEDLRLRAEALIALDRATEAVAVLTELRERCRDEPAVLQRLAILQFQRGRHDEAFRLARQLGESTEHKAVALCIQATFYGSLRRAPDAVRCLEQALALNPEGDRLGLDPETLPLFFGAALLDVGRARDAREWIRKALQQKPTAQAYWYLGEAEMGSADLEAAERAWRRSLEMDPKDTTTLVSLGNLALMRNAPIEALEWLTMAQKLESDSVSLHAALARANARLGREDLAKQHTDKAEELRRQAEATQDDELLLTHHPEHLRARLLLTRRAVERGNIPEAKALLAEVLPQLPNTPEVRELRAILEAQ